MSLVCVREQSSSVIYVCYVAHDPDLTSAEGEENTRPALSSFQSLNISRSADFMQFSTSCDGFLS